jgi:hypothetical protein
MCSPTQPYQTRYESVRRAKGPLRSYLRSAPNEPVPTISQTAWTSSRLNPEFAACISMAVGVHRGMIIFSRAVPGSELPAVDWLGYDECTSFRPLSSLRDRIDK